MNVSSEPAHNTDINIKKCANNIHYCPLRNALNVWYNILTYLSPISLLFHTHLVFITLPVNRCVDCLLVLLTLWNSAVKYKTLWMQMLTDEYLTWLFIKHGNAQRSGAGEGESLSVSTERTAGRWQAATGPTKDSLHWSRAANNVMCAENVQPMAASD